MEIFISLNNKLFYLFKTKMIGDQEVSSPLFKRLQKWNIKFKTNKCHPEFDEAGNLNSKMYPDEHNINTELGQACRTFWDFNQTATGFMTYMIIAMLITDVLLMTDLFVKKEKYLYLMHAIRIIAFSTILIFASVSFYQGYRQGPVNATFNVIAKFITFAILVTYSIVMATRYKKEPSTFGLLILIGSILISILMLLFFIKALIGKIKGHDLAMMTQTPFIAFGIFGALVSIFQIVKLWYFPDKNVVDIIIGE